MYRPVPLLVPLFLANYQGLHVSDFFDLISGPGSPRQEFASKNTHRINGGVTGLTAVRSKAIGDDFFFFFDRAQRGWSASPPSLHFDVIHSFLGADRR